MNAQTTMNIPWTRNYPAGMAWDAELPLMPAG